MSASRHTCTHAYTDRHVENMMSQAAYRMGSVGIKIVEYLSSKIKIKFMYAADVWIRLMCSSLTKHNTIQLFIQLY